MAARFNLTYQWAAPFRLENEALRMGVNPKTNPYADDDVCFWARLCVGDHPVDW